MAPTVGALVEDPAEADLEEDLAEADSAALADPIFTEALALAEDMDTAMAAVV